MLVQLRTVAALAVGSVGGPLASSVANVEVKVWNTDAAAPSDLFFSVVTVSAAVDHRLCKGPGRMH